MENDPTRRRLLPPRPPSATNLSSRRHSLLPPLHNPATRFTTLGSASGSGGGSISSYCQTTPSSLPPTASGGVDAGGSSRHARSQPSSSAPGSLPRPNLQADMAAPAATPRRSNLSPLPPSHPPVTDAEYTDLLDDDDVDDMDDPDNFVSHHMDLEGLGKLNSSGDSSQNVAMSSADRIDVSPSADSFTEKLNSGSKEKLTLPSPGAGAAALFEYANGKFSEARMKKIMADKHLAELMLTDPTRVKRLLSNRKCAAKAKDRNERHISELEHRFQMMKMEASTLSARLKWLQTKSAELTKQNNELKIRLQSAEKVARVKEGLHETLCAEVQILKRLTTD